MCGYCQRSDGRRRLGPFPSFGLPKNLGACRGLHLSWAGICVLDRDIRTACITGLPALNLDKPPRSAQLGVEATHDHKQFRSARCRTSRALTSWMRRRAEEEEEGIGSRDRGHCTSWMVSPWHSSSSRLDYLAAWSTSFPPSSCRPFAEEDMYPTSEAAGQEPS